MTTQIEGRLAAIEVVCSLLLHRTGRHHYGSAWKNYLGEKLQKAIVEVRKIVSGDAATAAEDSLGRMFNRSAI
jgi:hypothetical protein